MAEALRIDATKINEVSTDIFCLEDDIRERRVNRDDLQRTIDSLSEDLVERRRLLEELTRPHFNPDKAKIPR